MGVKGLCSETYDICDWSAVASLDAIMGEITEDRMITLWFVLLRNIFSVFKSRKMGKFKGETFFILPRRRWWNYVKMDLSGSRIGACELDLSGSGEGPMAGSYECNNEWLGFVKWRYCWSNSGRINLNQILSCFPIVSGSKQSKEELLQWIRENPLFLFMKK